MSGHPCPRSLLSSRRADPLRDALERVLTPGCTAGRSLAGLLPGPLLHRSSAPIQELTALWNDGTSSPLILKDVRRRSMSRPARRAKPRALHDPRREIEVYRAVLEPNRIGAPAYCGALVQPEFDRYWLVLEHVAGDVLARVGRFAAWQQAARTLAALHARFAGSAETLRRSAPLLDYDAEFYRAWPIRSRQFTRDGHARVFLSWLAARYEQVVEHLLEMPATLLHGEFYASNVLVRTREAGGDICPIDWEMAAIGPGVIDLAALTAGGWTAQQRHELALAYARESSVRGVGQPSLAALRTDLAYGRLHVAMQWLGWSRCWSPPPEQAHDWLGEARRCAEEIGL